MKINCSKLSPARSIALIGLGTLSVCLPSCKLPSGDRYSKAEWAVHTSVTKEDFPVGVALEHVEDAPMPTAEEIANGLPYHGGGLAGPSNWSPSNSNVDPLNNIHDPAQTVSDDLLSAPTTGNPTPVPTPENPAAIAALPPVPEPAPMVASVPPTPQTSPKPPAAQNPNAPIVVQTPELASFPMPPAPKPQPTVATVDAPPAPPSAVQPVPEIEVRTPKIEIKPAVINPTPENHARMIAASTRPPMAPRGNVSAPKPATEAVASNSTPSAADELAQILKLAKRVEEAGKR